MKSNCILVLGKHGQVSSAIRDLDHPIKGIQKFVFLSRKEIDFSVNFNDKFLYFIDRYKPCLVINAMAYTAVDKAEEEQQTAMKINGYSLYFISKICGERGIPLFHLSTDYVFNGINKNSWTPYDQRNPLGIYGLSKLFGEDLIKSNIRNFQTKAIIFRVSWVFNDKGKNFVRTILDLTKNNNFIKIVNDQIGGPASAKSIAKAFLDLLEPAINDFHPIQGNNHKFPWGVYHFQGEPKVSWFQFGEEIISLAKEKDLIKKDFKINPIKTANFPTACQRPLNTRLDCSETISKLGLNIPFWKDDLRPIIKNWGT